MSKGYGMDSIFIFLDRIYRIDGIFFASGERPFGRRPLYPDDPVDPVKLLFKDKNPFLKYSIADFKETDYDRFIR
jgi:hypothetical protein